MKQTLARFIVIFGVSALAFLFYILGKLTWEFIPDIPLESWITALTILGPIVSVVLIFAWGLKNSNF